MTRSSMARSTGSGLAVTLVMVMVLGLAAHSQGADAEDDHAVLGRFSISSEAGGAIWAFQPGGLLIVTGPGDISSEGTWSAAAGEREFDATVDYDIAGQVLMIQGQVAPGGGAVAVFVSASQALKPGDAEPWPAESRLVGERFGMVAEPTPEPGEPPADCLRPRWIDDEVDWDRCHGAPSVEVSPSPAGSAQPVDA